MTKRTITLDHITKIEGHAALRITLKDGVIETCELSSVEGSRYFEELLQGRDYSEAFELTSRICGICSCAHTICSITAMENALKLTPSPQTYALRELIMIGERIRSHATHLYFLALPDYCGYESAMAMLPKYKADISRALRLMKAGNAIIKSIGGRDIHPVSAAVGGFVRLPTSEDLHLCREQLAAIKDDAHAAALLFMKLPSPDFSVEREMLSLQHPGEYAMLRGCIQTSEYCYPLHEYDQYFQEFREPHSTAKFVVRKGKEYRVGALSRVQNNHQLMSPDAQKMLRKSGLTLPCFNPFLNNLAQAIEMIHCIDHALTILRDLKIEKEEIQRPVLRECRGVGVIEVPRGLLWHEYVLDSKGKIVKADIITPTQQNLRAMQEDIRAYLPTILHLKRPAIELQIEKLLRAYDPCFSCSTHFLEVEWG